MRGLTDKVAVVTGALGDLGWASAVRLAEEGCSVALMDIKPDTEGKAASIGCSYYQVDIVKEDEIIKACADIERQIGPVSILVNSAAYFVFKGTDAAVEDWQKILSTNVMGTALVTKHIVPQMKQHGSGSIINISSISGFVGQMNFATYNSTKFALRGLAKCWAHELAPFKIRANALCPGYIYTSAFVNSCKQLGLDIEEENRKASAMHLLGRQGRPEEVAGAVAFLASEDATFITGSDLLVDGGYLAK
jgi:NAD(P)-dependent dehydrogenase (short-subunit alcohol dehydrogenase family)